MKTCFKCGQDKPHNQFYRHPMMADGYLGKCKDCTKQDVRLNWHSNAMVLRQTDRLRRRVRQKQANTAVGNALRDGKLVKATACYYCDSDGPLAAHHWNYYRPLDVIWLCTKCHAIADAARRDAETKVLANEVA